jgi:hypothetical protein
MRAPKLSACPACFAPRARAPEARAPRFVFSRAGVIGPLFLA